MPEYRSKTSTGGRNMAGARALWRATGMKDDDFSKPIIAVANSFTQFVPGHVHLKDMGQLVAREIEKAGGVAKEFNTIAIPSSTAMDKKCEVPPHTSLPSPGSLGQLESAASEGVTLASGDVEVCFYQYSIPKWLQRHFALPAIRARFLTKKLKDKYFKHQRGGRLQFAVRVLPMGW